MIAESLSSLSQVRAFVKVAQHGAISRATASLFRTQSVVTRAIRDLEDQLGAALFERHAGGMILTGDGEAVLPRAKRIVEELQAVPRYLSNEKSRLAHTEEVEALYLFNTQRLRIFVRLCETRHVQTAARTLGLTQPALSAALKVLESNAGQRLFERTPRGLVLTVFGRAIEPNVRRALNELAHLPSDIAHHRGVLEGSVRIGALPLGRTRILPEAIIRITSKFPGVRVVTNESPFEHLVNDLRFGELDFIFGALRPEEYANDLTSEALLSESLVLLVRPGHPLLGRRVRVSDLSRTRWIVSRAHTPARRLLENCMAKLGVSNVQPAVETGDLALIRGLLLRSDLVAAVSMHQLEHEMVRGELNRLEFNLPDTTRSIGVIQRSGAIPSPVATALLSAVRQVATEEPGGTPSVHRDAT